MPESTTTPAQPTAEPAAELPAGQAPAEVLLAHAATLEEPLGAVAAHRLAELAPMVVERLAVWNPQLAQRGVSKAQWAAWEPLVRVAVLCAKPSNETVAGDMLGTALGLTQYAVTQRRTQVKAEFVFRESTAATYLATLPTGTQHVKKSHLKFLVAGITSALTDPVPAPRATPSSDAPDTAGNAIAALNPAEDGGDGRDEDAVEPLLLNRARPTRTELGELRLTSPAATEVLEVLAAIRARVLSVEPAAMRREARFRGRGRTVPYGDIEVVALLAAAAAQRTTKGKHHATAAICLGVGAGIAGETAGNLRGADIIAHDEVIGGPAVRTPHGVVPLHEAFAAPVLAAATAAGPRGYLLGGAKQREQRIGRIGRALSTRDPRLVRLHSSRLVATWFALHLTRGVPVGQLLAAQGYTSAAALDTILTYLPAQTERGNALLGGRPVGPVTTASLTDLPTQRADAGANRNDEADAERAP